MCFAVIGILKNLRPNIIFHVNSLYNDFCFFQNVPVLGPAPHLSRQTGTVQHVD